MVSLTSSTSRSTTKTATAFVLTLGWCWTFLSILTSLPQTAHAASQDDWRARSIYQIITDRFGRTDGSLTAPCDPAKQRYCGGTFEGIMNQLDYIQGMGFTAIWISPVVENIPQVSEFGEGYHGFWTYNIYNINAHFGTADSLKALTDEVHRRGMYIMVDVVVNNVAVAGNASQINYAKDIMPPFNDKKYFHQPAVGIKFDDQWSVQNGWLAIEKVSLADLDTESQYVQDVWHKWVKDLVSTYNLDGLRIDAAKHVNKNFWPPFQEAAGVFTMGEVYNAATDTANDTCSWARDALSTVLNFPVWWSLQGVLSNASQPMGGLGYMMNQVATGCHDSTILGTFAENHDVARFGSLTGDLSQRRNAAAFAIMSDGIPVIYYGQEQGFNGKGDPGNREALWLNPTGYDRNSTLYQTIRSLNLARNAVNLELHGIDYSNWSGYWAHKAKILYSTQNILVLRKGYDTSVIVALTNVGEGGPDVGPFHMGETNFVKGQTIVEVMSCNSTSVGDFGEFDLTLKNGEPQIWVPARYLHTVTGLCDDLLKKLNASGATTERLASAASPSSPQNFTLYLSSIAASIMFVLFAGSLS